MFVPDPAKGVSEMVRAVVPGGAVVTYMWDMLGVGFPLDPIYSEVQTREITVDRAFASFDDFWMTNLKSPALRPTVAAMKFGDVETLISRVRARLPADADGRITYGARAHAVRGRRPK